MQDNQKLKHNAEVALWQATKHFRALRSVAFLLGESGGKGPSEWHGEPLLDLEALLDVIAQQGLEISEAGLEDLQGLHLTEMLPQA